MTDSKIFDYAIIGAGLAGIALADSLSKKGASVCVIDRGDVASGASGTPLALVNPATGRYGTMSWQAENCYRALFHSLDEVQSHSPIQFFKKTGVLRPALDSKIASRMQENVHSSEWPDGWCKWLDEKEIRSINPDISCKDGGMWLPIGLTVDPSRYLSNRAEQLKSRGVIIHTEAKYNMTPSVEQCDISFKNGEMISSRAVIYTSGYHTKETDFWGFLPLIPVKGQTASFETTSPINFDYAISALGYIATLSEFKFILGSTYEHTFEDLEPDEKGLEYLIKRMSRVYPSLIKSAKLISQWAGVRASTPNRKPILGRHPVHKRLHVFAGLGSKGLLYSEYLSQKMSDYLVSGVKLPEAVSINRIKI